ncbi:chemotaxis protein CheW [Dongia rigui]|uniref:histidine kinase n=1 Tax=Dongia rigui TaxID=940149 RepID=A0ABU5DTA1_9PROT|nr:chemotaxis protein CheW [Dongia rigui]MDY0870578.1 chemotaxis protein CheW [Dongia rigui]
MDDLLSEFLTETNENLAVLDVELVKLEQNPNDIDLLSNIFRLVHTVKGTCGFLGLPRLESVAHAGENVLGKVRDGELEVTAQAVTLILACLDRIRSIMGDLEATGTEPEGDDSELIKSLNAFADGKAAAPAAAAAPAPAPAAPAAPAAAEAKSGASIYEQIGGMGTVDAVVEVMFNRIMGDLRLKTVFEGDSIDHVQGYMRDHLAQMCGGPATTAPHPISGRAMSDVQFDALCGHLQAALNTLEVPQQIAAMIMGMVYAMREEATGVAPAAVEAAPAPVEAKPVKAAPAKKETADADTKESAIANQSIRVNVELLENLMTMVSELVLTRNQVLQILRKHKDSEFAAPLQRLNHVTSELQEGVMKTRMQPIGNAWAKLPRIIRDLSHELKKKIDLVMIGQETELDRQVLEMIKDPLTHMVRNSADHAIEIPEERRRAGKPETGKITLNAYHEGGHIIIEVNDDGKGLALDKIKAKILQNNLATEGELENMSDQQIQQYIFKAGFSTAAKVTSVSGRGVGMDVVRTNIEKIGGTIELRSVEGKGTSFSIKIPLTLAIVSALVVECAAERFAIPQISVVELVRASPTGELKVERINDTPILRLRNKLLPLVSLREKLKLQAETDRSSDDTFIVVTQVGTYQFGIMVDRVFDTEEIVVKPVAPILRHIEVFSGNTILGDGSVIMILDPNGIAAASGQISMGDADAAEKQALRSRAHGDEAVPLLLFRAGEGAPKAVPLALVARLEEIERTAIERSNDRLVVQYRGQLMPLVPLEGYPDMSGKEGRQPVLVFSDREHSMGLMVDEIVDIVEAKLNVDLAAETPGRIGSAIIAGQATDIIDTGFFLSQAFADWFGSRREDSVGDKARRVLMVDDSAFFRNLLAPQLAAAGFSVTAVDSGDKAMELAEAGEEFDLIISDIEMPGMDGFAFCEAVKKSGRWQQTPIIALSSHASPKELAKGREVGFDDYVAKYDREGLVHILNEALSEVRGAA